jgi:hypothetical protein
MIVHSPGNLTAGGPRRVHRGTGFHGLGSIDVATVAAVFGYSDPSSQQFFTELQGLINDRASASDGEPFTPGNYTWIVQTVRWMLNNQLLTVAGLLGVFALTYYAGKKSR